jgi:hypothetical protein
LIHTHHFDVFPGGAEAHPGIHTPGFLTESQIPECLLNLEILQPASVLGEINYVVAKEHFKKVFFEPGSRYVAQAGLNSPILLPLPPSCWEEWYILVSSICINQCGWKWDGSS